MLWPFSSMVRDSTDIGADKKHTESENLLCDQADYSKDNQRKIEMFAQGPKETLQSSRVKQNFAVSILNSIKTKLYNYLTLCSL